jgi:hypothetical protein
MNAASVVRIMSQANNEEPQETIIIKRCNMSENEITDAELEQIIKDLNETPDDELEYLGDEEIDDSEMDDTPEDEMMDDTEDEYL